MCDVRLVKDAACTSDSAANAVDGGQTKLQLDRDKAALVSYRPLDTGVVLPAKRAIGRCVEDVRRTTVLAASTTAILVPAKNKGGPHCKFGGAAALEQSVKAAVSNIGATPASRRAANSCAGVRGSPKFGVAVVATALL